MKEKWRDIEGYENLYQISNLGKVKSLKDNKGNPKETIKKPTLKDNGYFQVELYKNGKRKHFYVHRLVALAFIPNPNNLPEVDHINGNKSKNEVWNLRWVDKKGNMNNPITKEKISGKNSYMYGKKGKDNPFSKRIVQLTLDNKLIKIWDCMTDISRENGYDQGSISRCCNGKSNTYKGFIWMFYENYINMVGDNNELC